MSKKSRFPRLTELRQKAGLDQVDLVPLAGVSRDSIGTLEKGGAAKSSLVWKIFHALSAHAKARSIELDLSDSDVVSAADQKAAEKSAKKSK